MTLDTENTIYIATDVTGGSVHVLVPRKSKRHVEHLRLDDPDPESTDRAEYQLLEKEMDDSRIEI